MLAANFWGGCGNLEAGKEDPTLTSSASLVPSRWSWSDEMISGT